MGRSPRCRRRPTNPRSPSRRDGRELKEGAKINQSLSALGNVIDALPPNPNPNPLTLTLTLTYNQADQRLPRVRGWGLGLG